MKITAQNIAVLDDNKDGRLSRWVEECCRLDHDGALQEHYLKYINPGDVVIDGGAAIGDHTLAYIRAVGATGAVHAFEPNPLMLECLRYNCPGAVIHPVALSDLEGVERLFHIEENAGASFLTPAPGGPPVSFFGVSDSVGLSIKTSRLDDYAFNRVDFIKLDLEGHEEKALLGSRETLLRCRPRMILEVSSEMLKRAGSSVKRLHGLLEELRYAWRAEIGETPTDNGGLAEMYCYPL